MTPKKSTQKIGLLLHILNMSSFKLTNDVAKMASKCVKTFCLNVSILTILSDCLSKYCSFM